MPQTTGLLVLASFLCCASVFADTSETDNDAGKEPVAILELAGATNTSLTGGGSGLGPSVAVEVTPIENWLEIEIGAAPFFQRHRAAEWDTDILFKKPWVLSGHLELMAGLGPEWVYSKVPAARRNSIAAESALDLMYWPGSKHRFGMFIEPGYDYNFFRGHEQSFGVSAGLLIGIFR